MDEVRSLISSLSKVVAAAPPPSPEEIRADLDRAEQALWSWYLEWSQVARIAIKDRTLLRRLGFLTGGGGSDDATTEPVAPAPTTPSNGAAVAAPAVSVNHA